MDEEMILMDNIMPVDIAIRRELEYRKKVEALRKHLNNDSGNDFLPIEEPIANLTGVKRKALAINSQSGFSLPHPSTQQQDFRKQPAGLICITCDEEFSTLHYLKWHCSSQSHKQKLLRLRNMGENIGNPLWCKLCNAPGSSPIVIEQHLQGLKHESALKMLEIERRDAGCSNG